MPGIRKRNTIPAIDRLLCPVRGCGKPFEHIQKQLVCGNRHSFDIARGGYVNLLQPQDRRSKNPGDSAQAVAARRRLHDKGFTAPSLTAIAKLLSAGPGDRILDAGCGEGFYAGSIAKLSGCAAAGADISTPAVDAAARRYPECLWIAANADRFLPFMDRSFSKVLSITARMNAPEFRRVLREDGILLVAVPAPDDLIELRGEGRERATRTAHCFAKEFKLVHKHRVTSTAELDKASVEDVLHSIYRTMQPQPAKAMRVTFSLDLMLFQSSAS